MRKLQSCAHSKHLIMYHIIFVPHYRKRLFINQKFTQELKEQLLEISLKYDFEIETIEIETIEIDPLKPDHIHILLRSIPKLSRSMIVRVLKQESTIWMWIKWERYLKNFYFGTRKIWARRYFVSSVGNVSADQVEKYLEQQAQEVQSA